MGELFIEAYPNKGNARGIPYTGLSNARPETLEIISRLEREKAMMPKGVQELMD